MPFPTATDATSKLEAWSYFNRRCAEWGLSTPELVDAYGVQFCPTEALATYGIRSKRVQGRDAILLPYFDELGNKTGLFNARMIGGPPTFDAPPKGLTAEQYQKLLDNEYPRYIGSTKFDLHFPPFPSSWLDQTVIFATEGMGKATKACRAGLPCVSVQGKDMFSLKGTNLLVPGLERILDPSKGFKVTRIIYIADSDAHKREDIRNAAVRLVGLLNGRKKSREFASFAILPDLPNLEKVGLDDYLNTRSPEEFLNSLPNWLQTWEGGRYFELMDKLNERITWIRGTTNYVDRERRIVVASAAASILVRPLTSSAGTLTNPYAGYTIKNGAANLGNTFDADPYKAEVDGVDFYPGMSETLADGKYNLWLDHSPEIEAGDIAPFLRSWESAICSLHERNLAEMLVAHRILHPQEKSPLMVFCWGGEGSGKSACVTALFNAITSPEYYHIGELDVAYSHETRHIFKQAVCLEDPTKSGMTNKDLESHFKVLGDNETIHVNPKGISGYNITNRLLVWINSNDPFLPVSGTARRWLVVESTKKPNERLAQACWQWQAATPNFGGRLRHYLLEKHPKVSRVDLLNAAHALESKATIVLANQSPAITEYEEFLDSLPDELLALEVVPTRLMYELPPYREQDRSRRSAFSQALSRGYPIVKVGASQDGKVKIADGVNTTFRYTTKAPKISSWIGTDLKDVYLKWENHPFFKHLFTQRKF